MTIPPIRSNVESEIPTFLSNRVTLVALSVLTGFVIGWMLKSHLTGTAATTQSPSPGPATSTTGTKPTAKFTADDIMRNYEQSYKRVSLWLPDQFTCRTNDGVISLEKDEVDAFLVMLSDKVIKSQNADDIAQAMATIDRTVPVTAKYFSTPRFKIYAMNKELFKWSLADREYALVVTDNNCEILRDAYLKYLILTNRAITTYLDHFVSAAQAKDIDKCEKYFKWFVNRKYGSRIGHGMELVQNDLQFSIQVLSKNYFADNVPKTFDPHSNSIRTFRRRFSVDRDFKDALQTL